MKKEYRTGTDTIIVKDGTITINGDLSHRGVYSNQIKEIQDSPKSFQDLIRFANTDGKVYVAGGLTHIFIAREIAEEAARQTMMLRKKKAA